MTALALAAVLLGACGTNSPAASGVERAESSGAEEAEEEVTADASPAALGEFRFELTAPGEGGSPPNDEDPVGTSAIRTTLRVRFERGGAPAEEVVDRVGIDCHGAGCDVAFDLEEPPAEPEIDLGAVLEGARSARPEGTVRSFVMVSIAERGWTQFFVYHVVGGASHRVVRQTLTDSGDLEETVDLMTLE